MKQQQRNRHLRLDVERLGTVLERRTRERDVAYAELETIIERRPNKLKTVQTLTKEHDKLAKRFHERMPVRMPLRSRKRRRHHKLLICGSCWPRRKNISSRSRG